MLTERRRAALTKKDSPRANALKGRVRDSDYTPSDQVFSLADVPRIANLLWLSCVLIAYAVEVAS